MKTPETRSYGVFSRMQPTVFFGSAGIVVLFCLIGGAYTEMAARVFGSLQSWIVTHFGWYYVLLATGCLVFALAVLISPVARFRLGKPDEEPEFTTLNWFAMLFAAGMGTGLVFWGVAEPLNHYISPNHADPRTPEAAREAISYVFFHWGLHPWAIYLILALSIGYFHFRIGLPLAPRSVLYSLIGNRIYGITGHLVDILCTVGTLLGVATSLGLGAMQINAGLSLSTGMANATINQILIIAVITAVATTSVVIGIHGGIQRLSRLNLVLAAILMGFVFLAGPTVHILNTFVGGMGVYLESLVQTSLDTQFASQSDWQAEWTLFYWGWWISWSPFVGIFVARISRGRTVREMIAATLIVPSLITFFWLSVFGGTALYMERASVSDLASQVTENTAISLHALLSALPLDGLTTIFGTLVVIIFFITSSDSGSLVDDMVTSGGHPNPPTSQRIFWAVSEGAVAATLLLVGGLAAIQQAAISMGLPMSLLLIAAGIGLVRAFRTDLKTQGAPSTRRLRQDALADD